MENLKDLGSAMGFASKYNGKPALITKSGSVYRGDDYLEVRIRAYHSLLSTQYSVLSTHYSLLTT